MSKTLLALSLAAMLAAFAGTSSSAAPSTDDELRIIWPDCVNGKCMPGNYCDAGHCKPGCISDSNCMPHMYCTNHVCGM